MHGGSTPQAREAAARRVAENGTREVTGRFAQPRPVAPLDALEEEMARCQGWIDFLEQRIRERPQETAWIAVYQAERAQLARLAHQMIVTRSDERRLVLDERTVAALEGALNGILGELGHDPRTAHVRGVVARHLHAVGNGTPRPEPTPSDDVPPRELPPPVAF